MSVKHEQNDPRLLKNKTICPSGWKGVITIHCSEDLPNLTIFLPSSFFIIIIDLY